jgi:hypothetical protein
MSNFIVYFKTHQLLPFKPYRCIGAELGSFLYDTPRDPHVRNEPVLKVVTFANPLHLDCI